MSDFKRYSRILIPLPPDQEVKDKVSKLVSSEFRITPEYVKTPYLEGYAISWRSWFGFDENKLNYPSLRSFFPLHIKRIFDDWLGEDEDDDMQVVEWIDEERWKWLDAVKDMDEIFHSYYSLPHISVSVYVYPDSLHISTSIRRYAIRFTNLIDLLKVKEAYPIFKILARRGYWNFEEMRSSKVRDEFYEKIGFRFEDDL